MSGPYALPRSKVPLMLGGATAFTLLYGMGLTFRNEDWLRFQSNILYNLPALAALAIVPFAVKRSRGRERIGWLCIATTIACWQAGDWAYAWYDYVQHTDVPFPGLPDWAYYVGYAACITAVPLLVLPERRLRDGRWLIDAAIVIMVAGAFAWEFIMRPLAADGGAGRFAVAVALGYPLLDLGLLSALVVALYGSGARPSPRALIIGAATLAQIVGDSLYLYVITTTGYDPYGNPIEVAWVAVYALFAVAMVAPDRTASVSARASSSTLGLFLPYAVLLPLGARLVATADGLLVAAAAAGAFALVTLRQMISLRENARLVDDLGRSKATLQQQSVVLETTLAAERERGRRDSLTGVLNHGAIAAELRALIDDARHERCAVVMIDINNMKALNDTFGHQLGDLVLVEVARAIQCDGAIVGRYGGDEFVAILPGAGRAEAEKYRDRVCERLAQATLKDPELYTDVPADVSIGIAVYPEEAGSVGELIQQSDSAMYAVKRNRTAWPDGLPASGRAVDERAAKMVGELVPLLTSPGDLATKLQQVERRLTTGTAYESVRITLAERAATGRLTDPAPARPDVPPEAVHALLARTNSLAIINDLEQAAHVSGPEIDVLRDDGLRAAMVVAMTWHDEPIGAITVASRRRGAFTAADGAFLASVATQVTAIVRMARLVEELGAATTSLEASQAETVMMLAAAAEAHDRTTGLHLHSIRELAEALARELGYDEAWVGQLGLAAVLHDIGKFSVPDSVLSSTGKLPEEDWHLMKQHTVWGSDFLSSRRGFALAATVARSHHERWDGLGYPDGLRGSDIPEAAAIVTVADSFDAMTHDRPYRARRPLAEAVDEVRRCSGAQFSPRIVEALVRLWERGEVPHSVHEDGAADVAAAA